MFVVSIKCSIYKLEEAANNSGSHFSCRLVGIGRLSAHKIDVEILSCRKQSQIFMYH